MTKLLAGHLRYDHKTSILSCRCPPSNELMLLFAKGDPFLVEGSSRTVEFLYTMVDELDYHPSYHSYRFTYHANAAPYQFIISMEWRSPSWYFIE